MQIAENLVTLYLRENIFYCVSIFSNRIKSLFCINFLTFTKKLKINKIKVSRSIHKDVSLKIDRPVAGHWGRFQNLKYKHPHCNAFGHGGVFIPAWVQFQKKNAIPFWKLPTLN